MAESKQAGTHHPAGADGHLACWLHPPRGRPMVGDSSFLDLIRRVRAGEADAAEVLVRRYEPAIRRAVRLQLRDQRLRRILDSMDVCQSVLASFFVRAATGQYDLDRPAQLLNLLLTMARNKLVSQARKPYVVRRETHVPGEEHALLDEPPASSSDPIRQVDSDDLLQQVRGRLTAEERQLADLRSQGQEWTAIGAALGESPEALRKRLARALDRIVVELGLDELTHD